MILVSTSPPQCSRSRVVFFIFSLSPSLAITLPRCTLGKLTREADSVGSKNEGAQVGQAPHYGANGDGDVARSVLVRQLLPIKVAIHCAREQEQQVCKAARLDCRPSKHIPRLCNSCMR